MDRETTVARVNGANGPDRRHPIAAVVGASEVTPVGVREATELGRCLVDGGFRVLTGGLGGVMEAASAGARASASYRSGDVIGVLPTDDSGAANPFVDIPICTALGHGRNLVVVASADVVLALGGRSGTLSEVALAWTLGKPVIAVGTEAGWAARLAGEPIDDRRDDVVHGPLAPADAAALATALLGRR